MYKAITFFLFTTMAKGMFGQSKNYIDQPYVETSAYVDTFIVPDKIYISIDLKESDSKNKKSIEELELLLVAKLKEIGINTTQDLSVNDLSSNFRRYIFKGVNVLKNKNFILIVNSASLAGKVFAELESIDISNVRIIKTEYSKREELLLELKSMAVKKAKDNAIALVKPLNQKIGNAMYITDNNNNSNNINLLYGVQSNYQSSGAFGASNRIVLDGEARNLIDFEKIQFSCKVVVIFKIE